MVEVPIDFDGEHDQQDQVGSDGSVGCLDFMFGASTEHTADFKDDESLTQYPNL